MLLFNQFQGRKKSWRKVRYISRSNKRIRCICGCALLLELAFFVRESAAGGLVFVDRAEMVSTEKISVEDARTEEAETAPGTSGGTESGERSFGIEIRLRDGVVEFYRKEEFKSTN